jgi:hypothetical protein
LPQGKRDDLSAALLQPRHILGQFGRGREDGILFRMRVGPQRPLAPRRPVLRQGDALVLGIADTAVRD